MANKKIQELTVSGFEKLQAEYRQLNDVEKVQNQEDVATARAQGDLSENADYDAARARQGEIEDRLRQIEEAKQNCVILLSREVEKALLKEKAELEQTETIATSARLETVTFILEHKKLLTSDRISIGCKVRYLDKRNNEEKTVNIVGTVEANPFDGKISNISPLGVALYGKQTGDIAVVKAPNREYEVEILGFEVLE